MITEIDSPEVENEGEVSVVDARNFDVRRHNGRITIRSPRTGEHRTFKVATAKGGKLEGKRIVSLLTGSDNGDYGDWTGFGFADERGVSVWQRHRGTAFEKFGSMLQYPEHYIALGCEYLVEGRCRKCNRILTHPESIETGLGPVCGGRD